ncbi:MAG: M42 family metallopeptidase [Fusobacteriaceae bacterium]|nr:M42 family metallopeptidase [Fusobacteriaceae bacterium]MBN2839226.1 M42 family metallopeptidase [Fusobacteriaceae bacterium]
MEKYLDYTVNVLEKLLKIPSPTGDTNKIIEILKHTFEDMGLKSKITIKRGLIVEVEGEIKDKVRVISAHADTLGAMVKDIKSNGRLLLTQLGGYSWHTVDGENCVISTLEGKKYTGTILFDKTSVHNYGDSPRNDKRDDKNMEIRIDERVYSKDDVESLGINVGDFVSFDTRTTVTESGFIKSRHLDDKVSVAIILGLCKYIVENNIIPKYTLNFLISNYEEVGHGAAFLPKNSFEILAIDMASPGQGQTSKEEYVTICAKDSSGPYDYELRKKLVGLAKEDYIEYAIDIFNFYGSDASAAVRAGNNVRHGLIGPGVDASHGYERTHKLGILNTLKLLGKYIESL